MADIGKLNLKLVADPSSFEKGILKAGDTLKSFGASVAGGALGGNLFSSVQSGVSSLSSIISKGLSMLGPYGQAAAVAVGVVGGAFAAAIAGGMAFLSFMRSQWEHWKEIDKGAKSAGLSLRDYQGALALAGDNSEAMQRSLMHLNRTLGDAKLGSNEAQRAFRLLEIDPTNYRQGGDALRDIVQRLIDVGPGATQAAAAYKLFGRTGQEILPELTRDAQGLDKAITKLEARGLGFNAGDVEMARQANKGIKDMEESFGGIKNQVAVGLTPLLLGIVDSIGKAKLDFSGFGDTVLTVVEFCVGGFAIWIDIFRSISALANGTAAVLETAFVTAIQKIVDEFRDLLRVIADSPLSGKVGSMSRGMLGDLTALSFKMQQLKEHGQNFQDQARADIGFNAARGVKDFFDEVRRKAAQIRADMEKAKPEAPLKDFDAFERIAKEVQTPLEKFEEKMVEIERLRQQFAGDMGAMDILDRATAKAMDDFVGKAVTTAAPKALAQGSIETLSAINQAQRADRADTPEQRLLEVRQRIEITNQIAQDQLLWSRKLAQAALDGDLFKVAQF